MPVVRRTFKFERGHCTMCTSHLLAQRMTPRPTSVTPGEMSHHTSGLRSLAKTDHNSESWVVENVRYADHRLRHDAAALRGHIVWNIYFIRTPISSEFQPLSDGKVPQMLKFEAVAPKTCRVRGLPCSGGYSIFPSPTVPPVYPLVLGAHPARQTLLRFRWYCMWHSYTTERAIRCLQTFSFARSTT